jgi:hypothetical protein
VLDRTGYPSALSGRTARPWIFMLGIAVLLLMIAGISVFIGANRCLTSTTVYRDSLEIAQSSQEVQSALGTGIKAK